ncbi:Transposase IS4 [Pelomyxa schiedti]|nr:Transposase IS4 [Pelomyxa schiedti]
MSLGQFNSTKKVFYAMTCGESSLMMHFSSNWLAQGNWVKALFEQNRFFLMNQMLHFSNPDDNPSDRLRSIRFLIEHFNNKFTSLWHPGRNVTIDEAIVPFKGLLNFRVYVKNKPKGTGVKIFMLADEYSAIVKFIVYDAANSYGDLDANLTLKAPIFRKLHLENKNLSATQKTVLSLLSALHYPQSTRLTMDRGFPTAALIQQLHTCGIEFLVTCRQVPECYGFFFFF